MSLTQNLRVWRKKRNIINSDTKVFVSSVLEELLEIYSTNKEEIKQDVEMMMDMFFSGRLPISEENTIDCIQDITVFSNNETELMGYDNDKCNYEVFKHINCRKQDPIQYLEWQEKGAYDKWKKWSEQPKDELYEPNYKACLKDNVFITNILDYENLDYFKIKKIV